MKHLARGALAAVIALACLPAAARGTYPDGPRSTWFKSLKQPGNETASCCDVSDCHQTRAEQAPDGHWRAILVDGNATRWIDVPSEKVLKRPLSIDGEAYLCSSPGGGLFPATIYCFVPPIPSY